MAQDQLRYKITADSSGFVKGANQAQQASKSLTGSTKKNSQAFTQLAYAMDDAQYGFRGVQNNLQALAVSMGATGPVIIAITAALIATNYLITNFDKLGDSAFQAGKRMADAFSKEQGAIGNARLLAGILSDSTSNIDAQKWALEGLKKDGYDPAKHSLKQFMEYQKASIRLSAIQAAVSEYATEKLGENVKLAAGLKAFQSSGNLSFEDFALSFQTLMEDPLAFLMGAATGKSSGEIAKGIMAENEKDLGDFISEASKMINEAFGEGGLLEFLMTGKSGGSDYSSNLKTKFGRVKELMRAEGMDKQGLGVGSLEWIQNNVDFSKLDAEQTAYWEHQIALATRYANTLKGVTVEAEKMPDYSSMIQTGLSNIISGFAQAVGSGDDLGKALLGGIGNTLVQLGGMLIATGVGVEAFKKALKSLNGPVAIVAGAAMVALGAAFATAANKAGGGSGGSSSRRGSRASRVGNFTPSKSISGSFGSGNRVIGELELRGQNLVVGIQAATETRQTF